jgi:hypothetical protein
MDGTIRSPSQVIREEQPRGHKPAQPRRSQRAVRRVFPRLVPVALVVVRHQAQTLVDVMPEIGGIPGADGGFWIGGHRVICLPSIDSPSPGRVQRAPAAISLCRSRSVRSAVPLDKSHVSTGLNQKQPCFLNGASNPVEGGAGSCAAISRQPGRRPAPLPVSCQSAGEKSGVTGRETTVQLWSDPSPRLVSVLVLIDRVRAECVGDGVSRS